MEARSVVANQTSDRGHPPAICTVANGLHNHPSHEALLQNEEHSVLRGPGRVERPNGADQGVVTSPAIYRRARRGSTGRTKCRRDVRMLIHLSLGTAMRVAKFIICGHIYNSTN